MLYNNYITEETSEKPHVRKGIFMFDILSDVWAHPGAVHSPILPFDITDLKADVADAEVSRLHKCGIDSLLLRCADHAVPTHELLSAIFDAAAKRYMLIFVDESVLCAATSSTDKALVAFNPMLCAHRLALVRENEVPTNSERVLDIFVKLDNGKLADAREALDEVDDAENYEKYRLVSEATDGLDILCPECAEMLFYSAYQSFIEEYKEASHGTIVGLYTSRLMRYTDDTIYWSYDMLDDMRRVGCSARMLAALFMDGDRRNEKEGRRLYKKVLNARLDLSFCTPASKLCGDASLAFMGDVPQLFASGCGRRFTLPTWSREGYSEICDDRESVISAVRFLGDTARGEGFTGSAYKASGENARDLTKELNYAFTAVPALIILPECFASAEHLEQVGLRREDMKRLVIKIKRQSTLGTSCGGKSDVAVLCDDDLIPYSGSEKLRSMGVDFNFISKAQLLDKAHIHHGEILVDKFKYKVLLWDQRVRMEPDELVKIGEFPTFGGNLYRGGAFGDFAKKNIETDAFLAKCAEKLSVCRIDKCSCTFIRLANLGEDTVTVATDDIENCYLLDIDSGKKIPVASNQSLRILPGGAVVMIYDPSGKSNGAKNVEYLPCEIFALGEGENICSVTLESTNRAEIELDTLGGNYVDVTANGHTSHRVTAEPYSVDITNDLTDGTNSVTLASDNGFSGAVLRLYGLK